MRIPVDNNCLPTRKHFVLLFEILRFWWTGGDSSSLFQNVENSAVWSFAFNLRSTSMGIFGEAFLSFVRGDQTFEVSAGPTVQHTEKARFVSKSQRISEARATSGSNSSSASKRSVEGGIIHSWSRLFGIMSVFNDFRLDVALIRLQLYVNIRG